ncbi:MAG: flagellar basal-body rod protein FlgF [Alphaproteobacteria bacterium GWF2_58_20]|nr:MAG: flagellar basal-body rod protein FlgF [Alphaproteobacteria bacterium GWF2_58_20]
MENASIAILSTQAALMRQLDVTANNMANMTTPAYKRQKLLFREYVLQNTPEAEPIKVALDYATTLDMTQGALTRTGNLLDIALDGKGFFSVQGTDGKLYSRAGNLSLNSTHQLVDMSGAPVLNEGGQPITIPEGENALTIASNGSIAGSTGEIGRIGLFEFTNEETVIPVGATHYTSDIPPVSATETKVVQGAVENSNIEPITEMTSILNMQRQYQDNQKIIETTHDLTLKAISRIGTVA